MAELSVMEALNGSTHGISLVVSGVCVGKVPVINSLDVQPHVYSRSLFKSGNMCIN